MVQWVIKSIPHGGPIELFLVHIKEPLLLIRKCSPWGDSMFSISLSEWSFTICPMSYNRK